MLRSWGPRFSTRDTAAVLIALNGTPRETPDPKDTTVTVVVNGKKIRWSECPRTACAPFASTWGRAICGGGGDEVEIVTTGGVALFYSAELRQYDAAGRARPELRERA